MTTWASSIRHPWFNPPSMKRKLFTVDEDDDASYSSDVSPAMFTPSRRKRVKHDSLEHTLAHMTLGNALAPAPASEDADMWPKISPPHPRERETLNIILPSSVEEPGTVASEPVDVDMEVDPTTTVHTIEIKTPTDWEKQLDIKEVQISSAVLDCLRKQSKYPPTPIPLPPQTSQALVLYRAPRPPSPKPLEAVRDEEEKPTRTSGEEDVMEVE